MPVCSTRTDMPPLHAYLAGTSSWFIAFGLQGVMFAWLVTMVLLETPEKVGVAQMTLLLPGIVLMLIGGSLADRYGGATIAFFAQLGSAVPPLLMAYLVWTEQLSFTLMLGFAVLMGTAQAFVTPSRDGLLNAVAGDRVQRTVMLTLLLQFASQMAGVTLAGFAEWVGAAVLFVLQSAILVVGAFMLRRLRAVSAPHPGEHEDVWRAIKTGAQTVFSSPGMATVCLQNVAMGLFFMGSFMVTMPLLVREVFAGSASDLSWVNGANALGFVVFITVILRMGDVQRQGRALLLSQGLGGIVLAVAGTAPSFVLFVLFVFFWGTCGGMAMTMSRTIMQQLAPADQRGRVMAFFSFTFMGAGPVGTLLAGFAVQQFGPQAALIGAGLLMVLFILLVSWWGPLWRLRIAGVSA